MKVREVIKLIENDGWYLVGRKEAINNSNILLKKVWLLFQDINFRMKLSWEH